MNRIVIATAAVLLNVLVWSAAWAQPRLPWGATASEIPLLPEDCRTYIKGGPDAGTYLRRFPGLVGFTHYCAGMNFMNRAKFTMNKTEKKFNLQSAIGEFGYVLKHSPQTATWRPQVKAQKDMAELMLRTM